MDNIITDPTEISVNNEKLILLPEKAIYYSREKALIIADIHLGKTGHFRNAGIPVPAELAFADLKMLDHLINLAKYRIEKLIILGDLFHAKMNIDWKIFEEWRERNADLEIHLIKGNHDILSDRVYEELRIEVFENKVLNSFLLIHDFTDDEENIGLYKLCGHIHPAVRILGSAKQALTLSCFYFNESIGVLPAFGRFTGKLIINPRQNDRVYVLLS